MPLPEFREYSIPPKNYKTGRCIMRLNPVISSGAVFQQNQPIVIFGEADGKVVGDFSGEIKECEANGKFVLEFSPRTAGGPYEIKVSCGDESVTLTDILVGRVILLAGQSNAELPAKNTHLRERTFADNPNVRLFQVKKQVRVVAPSALTADVWTSLTEENAYEWSAIALCTALHFNEKYGIPVGIIGAYQGASVIESFMSEDAIGKFDIDESKTMYDHIHPDFAEFNANSFLYHHIIEKVIPYRVSSAIWYQGESNTTEYEGTYYDKMLISLISEWRKFFANPEMPFAVVQINDFPEPPEDGFVAIQQAQKRAVEQLENCALVEIKDMGEHEEIHPFNKQEVSDRICVALEGLKYQR